MINQQLLDYIKQELQQGTDRETIHTSLTTNGWQASDIKAAFDSLTPPAQQVQPTPPVSSNPQPVLTSSPQPKKGMNKILLGVITLIVGLFMIGGSTFAYFSYFQPPEKIVQKMLTKLGEINSLEYLGEMKAEVNEPHSRSKASNFLINFNGVSDATDINNPKGLSSFNITTNVLGQENFNLQLEIRSINKVAYVKLGDLPNLGFFDLTSLSNQWIKIDAEALKKQFGAENIEEQLKEQELSPEQIEKLKIAIRQHKIFDITESLPSEKIEGVNTYHYKFMINKEGIKKLLADIIQIDQNKNLTEKELVEFDKIFEGMELPKGEMWIGKKDSLLYKISLSSVLKATEKSKNSGKFNFMLSFKNFNKPIQIEIPSPVKTIEDIMNEFSGDTSLQPKPSSPIRR